MCFNLFETIIGLQKSHAKIVISLPHPPPLFSWVFKFIVSVYPISIPVYCDNSRAPFSFLNSHVDMILFCFFLPKQQGADLDNDATSPSDSLYIDTEMILVYLTHTTLTFMKPSLWF